MTYYRPAEIKTHGPPLIK